jgi:hypothetical protein
MTTLASLGRMSDMGVCENRRLEQSRKWLENGYNKLLTEFILGLFYLCSNQSQLIDFLISISNYKPSPVILKLSILLPHAKTKERIITILFKGLLLQQWHMSK